MKNNIDKQYLELCNQILKFGTQKKTRNGEVLSIFGWQIRHRMSEGFPLLTTKKMAWKTMVTELLWFLRGDTNIKYLVDNNCHIWDGDAYKNWCTQFEIDSINFDGEEVAKGHNDQCWGYPLLENTSKEYKRGQINAYLEGKAQKPFFYLTREEFTNKIKTDDEFAKKWGELGPVYGKQWRSWGKNGKLRMKDREGNSYYGEINPIDQIANVINLLKTDPDSRRMIVNAWAVHDLEKMVLPPCHMMFQFYTRELSLEERREIARNKIDCPSKEWSDIIKLGSYHTTYDKYNIPTRAISLQWTQRSVDVGLGLPFNIASYALLLEIVAKSVNMVPEEVIGDLGDCHIYNNHIDGLKEQLTRTPYELPTVKIREDIIEHGNEDIDPIPWYSTSDFTIENYQSHPSIKLPLSN
jgi:thymidylate synthase